MLAIVEETTVTSDMKSPHGISGVPQFDEFQPGQVGHTIDALLEECKILLSEIITGDPGWQAVYELREQVERQFELMSLGEFLLNVCFSPEFAEEVAQANLRIARFKLRLYQDQVCYESLVSIRDSPDWDTIPEEQQATIQVRIKQNINNGIELHGCERESFNHSVKELEQLRIRFFSNMIQASRNDSTLKNLVSDSHDRKQREKAHRLLITRAASGHLDNRQICERIRQARHRQARLLGHDHYAKMRLGKGLESTPESLSTSVELLKAYQETELELLKMIAGYSYGSSVIQKWDYQYLKGIWDDRQGEATDAKLRPYFQHDHVLNGLFALCYQLFGIEFALADGEVPVWHDDVRFFRVLENKQTIGFLYYDPFERPGSKSSGAWAKPMPEQYGSLPASIIVCNFNSNPSLMSLREVETLFHEFGHFLQGIFQKHPGLSSIGNEISSTFFQYWINHLPTLKKISCHIESGESLPDSQCEQIIASKGKRYLESMGRLLEYGLLDLLLHSDSDTPLTHLQNRATEAASALPVIEGDYSYCTASHIFQHEGYSARVLLRYQTGIIYADKAFELFEQAATDGELAELGRQFREIVLARSGPEHETELVKEFIARNQPKQKPEPD